MIRRYILYFIILMTGFGNLISCVDNDDYSIPPIPKTGFFKETFDKTNVVAFPWPRIADVIGFDNALPVTYSDSFTTADIRKLNGNPCVWFPASKEASLIVDDIPTQGYKNLFLKYKFNAGIYDAGDVSNTNKLIVKCNDVEIEIPNVNLDTSNNKNIFYSVTVKIPEGTTKIEFYGKTENNNKGFRIDDIELIGDN